MIKPAKQSNRLVSLFYLVLLIVPSVIFAGVIGLLFYASLDQSDSVKKTDQMFPSISQVAQWFDPIFFQYNLTLLVFAVAVVPMITLFYIHTMREEKRQRLLHQLSPEALADQKILEYINSYLEKAFTWRHYLGSMTTLMLVIMFGCMIILLLKPMPLNGSDGTGVNYCKGANFLMLGTYMESYVLDKMPGSCDSIAEAMPATSDAQSSNHYIRMLIYTLTAFQFGFLGGYVYFIGLLVRSYFTLDMTPNLFIVSSVRMMIGSLLALVSCFAVIQPGIIAPDGISHDLIIKSLPVWSFMIGFFPSRGLTLLDNIATKTLGWARITEFSSPLSDLPGVNYDHEIRLQREGYDNIENFANADALDLALRTGYGYRQLQQWISQSQLHGHLRDDYQIFVKSTGISSMDELVHFWQVTKKHRPNDNPTELLIDAASASGQNLNGKIRILCTLAEAQAVTKKQDDI